MKATRTNPRHRRLQRLLLLAALCLTANTVIAQGMQFEPEGTLFQDAIKKARASGKHIFVDCYTSWCGPCKAMARDVFPTDSAGQFMNPRFVNLKIDMEKGEGPQLAKQWQVNAFPTFIVFDSNGTELNRFLGGSTTTVFLEKVGRSLTDKTFADLEKRYTDGERSREFLLDYVAALGKAQKSVQANAIAEQLLEGQAETFTKDKALTDVFIKYLTNPFCPAFIHVAKTPSLLESAVDDPRVVSYKLNNVWQRYPVSLEQQQGDRVTVDEAAFGKWVALMAECGVENREQLEADARIRLAQDKKDWQEYIKYVRAYWENPRLDVSDLQLLQWSKPFFHDCQDADAKDEVIKMMQTRIEELKSGKREAQNKVGNMMMPGDMKVTLQRVIDEMSR